MTEPAILDRVRAAWHATLRTAEQKTRRILVVALAPIEVTDCKFIRRARVWLLDGAVTGRYLDK